MLAVRRYLSGTELGITRNTRIDLQLDLPIETMLSEARAVDACSMLNGLPCYLESKT